MSAGSSAHRRPGCYGLRPLTGRRGFPAGPPRHRESRSTDAGPLSAVCRQKPAFKFARRPTHSRGSSRIRTRLRMRRPRCAPHSPACAPRSKTPGGGERTVQLRMAGLHGLRCHTPCAVRTLLRPRHHPPSQSRSLQCSTSTRERSFNTRRPRLRARNLTCRKAPTRAPVRPSSADHALRAHHPAWQPCQVRWISTLNAR